MSEESRKPEVTLDALTTALRTLDKAAGGSSSSTKDYDRNFIGTAIASNVGYARVVIMLVITLRVKKNMCRRKRVKVITKIRSSRMPFIRRRWDSPRIGKGLIQEVF